MALRLSRIKGVRSVMPVSIEALASRSSSSVIVVRMVRSKGYWAQFTAPFDAVKNAALQSKFSDHAAKPIGK